MFLVFPVSAVSLVFAVFLVFSESVVSLVFSVSAVSGVFSVHSVPGVLSDCSVSCVISVRCTGDWRRGGIIHNLRWDSCRIERELNGLVGARWTQPDCPTSSWLSTDPISPEKLVV